MMRFVFQRCDDVVKSFDVGCAHASDHGTFQLGQMAADAPSQLSALRGRRDDERATICFPDLARDQATPRQSVENTG